MVQVSDLGRTNNQILSRLSRDDLALLAPHLSRHELPLRKILETANKTIEHVYFIEQGLASVVASGAEGARIEVGLIGREGVTGAAVILGARRSINATYIQMKGDGYRIAAPALRLAMERSASLQRLLMHYLYIFMIQTAQTALANGHDTLEQRLARWLLMARDRASGESLKLTHEFLSVMLGVRRSGVTVALSALESRGLIAVSRGSIKILNRRELEKCAGSTYGIAEAEQKRLLG